MIYFIKYLNLIQVLYNNQNIMMYIPSVITDMKFKNLSSDGTLTVYTNIGEEIIPLINEYSTENSKKLIIELLKKGVNTVYVKE